MNIDFLEFVAAKTIEAIFSLDLRYNFRSYYPKHGNAYGEGKIIFVYNTHPSLKIWRGKSVLYIDNYSRRWSHRQVTSQKGTHLQKKKLRTTDLK